MKKTNKIKLIGLSALVSVSIYQSEFLKSSLAIGFDNAYHREFYHLMSSNDGVYKSKRANEEWVRAADPNYTERRFKSELTWPEAFRYRIKGN